MIGQAVLYGIALTCNCLIVSGTILSSPLKVDPTTLRLWKSGPVGRSNEFEYAIVKRGPTQQDTQESPDSKERRSQMGSSFIRFGRSRLEGNLENADYVSSAGGNELDPASRIARGRSDVIIRFGRSESKNFHGGAGIAGQQFVTRSDVDKLLGLIGNNNSNNNKQQFFTGEQQPHFHRSIDLDRVMIVCSNVLANYSPDPDIVNGNELYLGKLARLCNSLGLGIEENDENSRRKSKIIEILEDASQAESPKRE